MFIKKHLGLKQFILLAITGFSSMTSFAKVLDIQTWQTSNGAHVYFVATPEIPMVEINVVWDAGSARDGAQAGLAQLTNAMLDQGTQKLSADQIAQQFDDVGAQYGNSTTRDMAILSLQSLTDPKYFDPALKTFAEIIATPSFPSDAFTRSQKQVLQAIQQQQQMPDSIAKNAFFASVYQNLPYGHPVIGTATTVPTLTVSDLQKFYQRYYVARNAIITIVGAVTLEQAKSIANQIIGSLPAGNIAPSLPQAIASRSGKLDQIQFPSEQTSILMGQVGINYNNPSYFPLYVGNYMLGGATLTSLLFKEVREKRGLVYSIMSVFSPLAAQGPFAIVLQTRNDEAKQALSVTHDTLIQFMQKAPSQEELAVTKRKIINSFPLNLAGNDAISSNLVTIAFYHLPLDYLDTFRDKVNAVTAEQIKQAFAHVVQPDKLIVVTVGNSEK